MNREIIVLRNSEELAKKAANKFVELAKYYIQSNNQFNVALAGGGTPKQMHQVLASYDLDWQKIHILFSDERYVSPTEKNNNFHLAYESLVKHIEIPNENIHPILTLGISAKDSALAYQNTIKGLNKDLEIDAVFLGIGPDGHTASIFPKSPLINSDEYIEAIYNSPKLPKTRISFTLKLLNKAKNIFFLASGENKAKAIENILKNDLNLPANLVRPNNGNLFWLLDISAAKYLKRKTKD